MDNKQVDKMYNDFVLTSIISRIENAKTKKNLCEVISNLTIDDLIDRKDIINAFNKTAKKLKIDNDKIYSWVQY